MNVRQAYGQWAATYDSDRNLTRDLDQVVTRDTLGRFHCHSILELGSGTGKNTAFLSQLARQVYGIDFSEAMLSRAREKLDLDNVAFTVGDLTRPWPFRSQSAELISCNLVLEHIQDLGFIFSEAARSLSPHGRLFISELHPFRQYHGARANFQRADERTEIPAFVHHISDFLDTAAANGLALKELREWWHAEDRDKPPRLVSFLFEK